MGQINVYTLNLIKKTEFHIALAKFYPFLSIPDHDHSLSAIVGIECRYLLWFKRFKTRHIM